MSRKHAPPSSAQTIAYGTQNLHAAIHTWTTAAAERDYIMDERIETEFQVQPQRDTAIMGRRPH